MSDYQEKEKLSFELKEKDSSPQESETLHAKPVLTPGQTLAKHYEIISELGRGGNSIVYRARHLLLDEPCALKLLLPDRIPNEKAIRRFQQEAKAVSRLAHPNIIRLREFGIDDSGRPFLAMDFVEGTPLSSMIEGSGQLSVGQTIDLVSIACDALRHAHGEGVVHRDIKPSNILVGKGKDGTPAPKIVDFGIAKLEAPEQALSLTETGEIFGSPLYMSPEQCLGKPVDERTDVYALGCVLYECVFGKPPFTGESAIETLMAHVQEEPSIDESVCGKPLKRVIERCLAKSQADRYQSIAALQEDLSKAKRGEEPRHGAAKRRTGDKAAIKHSQIQRRLS